MELVKVKVDVLEDPHILQLGTIGSRSIIKYGADVEIEVAGKRFASYVDIANFDRYDMIIGIPWMRRNRVVLDLINNMITIDGSSILAIKIKDQDIDPRLRCHRVTDKRHIERQSDKAAMKVDMQAATVATSPYETSTDEDEMKRTKSKREHAKISANGRYVLMTENATCSEKGW